MRACYGRPHLLKKTGLLPRCRSHHEMGHFATDTVYPHPGIGLKQPYPFTPIHFAKMSFSCKLLNSLDDATKCFGKVLCVTIFVEDRLQNTLFLHGARCQSWLPSCPPFQGVMAGRCGLISSPGWRCLAGLLTRSITYPVHTFS